MEEFALEGQEWGKGRDQGSVKSKRPGGATKIAISEGLVKVDDAVELRKRCKIRSRHQTTAGAAGQVVEFDGSKVLVR